MNYRLLFSASDTKKIFIQKRKRHNYPPSSTFYTVHHQPEQMMCFLINTDGFPFKRKKKEVNIRQTNKERQAHSSLSHSYSQHLHHLINVHRWPCSDFLSYLSVIYFFARRLPRARNLHTHEWWNQPSKVILMKLTAINKNNALMSALQYTARCVCVCRCVCFRDRLIHAG